MVARSWTYSVLALGLAVLIAAPADAQTGGGGRGGGGHGGGRRGQQSGGKSTSSQTVQPPSTPDQPTNQIMITGVVTAIEPATNRVTIAYDPVEALNWPRGSQPFPVLKASLLDGLKTGEPVQFKLDSHVIYEITSR